MNCHCHYFWYALSIFSIFWSRLNNTPQTECNVFFSETKLKFKADSSQTRIDSVKRSSLCFANKRRCFYQRNPNINKTSKSHKMILWDKKTFQFNKSNKIYSESILSSDQLYIYRHFLNRRRLPEPNTTLCWI